MTIDAFDAMFDDKPQPPQSSGNYAVLPAGPADVEIVAASVGDVPWKASPTNPTGACLKLRLSAGREFSFVFADLPRDMKPLFHALAAALGLKPDAAGKISLGPIDQLVGRQLRIEVAHYQSKTGDKKACVRRWLPEGKPETAAPTADTPARKPAALSRNAVPEWQSDDIPF